MKLFDNKVLNSESLQDLEICYYLHLNTITLTSNLFPSYKDLDTNFDFRTHLQNTKNLTLLDYTQGMMNYDTIGKGLYKYLLDPKTILFTTCPESAIQLMPLHDEQDL